MVDHPFIVIDADAHHLDGPAYKNYLPERYRAQRSLFPVFWLGYFFKRYYLP